jgi:5-methylcytosine-specific restriction enzyme A
VAWEGSTTGQGSTRASRRTRDTVLHRDHHRCRINHPGCQGTATEAHHLDSIAAAGTPRAQAIDPKLYIAACSSCHDIETRRQATAARNAWKRRPESHPGLRH